LLLNLDGSRKQTITQFEICMFNTGYDSQPYPWLIICLAKLVIQMSHFQAASEVSW